MTSYEAGKGHEKEVRGEKRKTLKECKVELHKRGRRIRRQEERDKEENLS